MIRPTLLTAAVWLALAGHANAETPADPSTPSSADAAAYDFARIQVTATRTEREISDVPNTVDVITRERMDDLIVRDLKDLFRYEPGISVTSGAGRFSGLGSIRIRGLEANRVLILTDGIAVSDSFSFGSYLNTNRNFVDLDTLKRVEVVRGPASSMYGSDALGGVVAYVTKDPSDYLVDGKTTYAGFKVGYEGDWNGLFGGATLALGGQRWSGLLAYGQRQGQETDNQGDNASTDIDPVLRTHLRTAPNPQERSGRSLLGKLVYAPDDNQRFRLVVDANEDYSRIEAYTAGTLPSMFATGILDMKGRDHQTRARVSFEHEIDALQAGFADALSWKLYRQDSESTQRTDELRSNNSRRQMEHNFDQRVYGLQAAFHKGFTTGSVEHALTYGIDATVSDTKEKRDGTSTNIATGVVSNVVGQDAFPVRDFPISKTTKAGLYVQDEMTLADGRLTLVPALRVDHYAIDSTVDAIYAGDNPGVTFEDMSENSISPKFGAIWRFNDRWSLFGNYARGFRAPPYGDVNAGFINLQSGYMVIANPDLKSETSNGFELGLRFGGEAVYAGLTGYYNDYRDFIESQVLVSPPGQMPMIFQSRNVADARIYGVELKAGVDLGALSDAMEGWSLRGAAAWSRGDDKTDDVPLNSVDPLRGSLGIAYDSDGWGVELAGAFAQRQKRTASASQYRPAGYGALDLFAHWEFAPGAKVNLGLLNLTDKRYTDWADVNGIAATSLVLDRYTRPGRTLSASLSVNW
ncbi:TonB-dependent hemoglobin/transferrin/lactoferrin family receptor [Pseudoxanthomonas sp. PXM01]|uniref:TonB-dependent hemoglobin/transferrin/lactoferrin family receptor n=1 Tax=Pseudoxanthomonas sp. PXM01 TaxID=2769295 RepID=UPI00177FB9C7|nr:TonB-dependent hemoglobin/transferrin/lactoferrin family receptor [Pseudoxanthomonas sp. PXM01]MBD9468788.1 TonB-dependent hemoglobin/transferrin/lactoferrin family receptor [Pseudoxanthomonas sp. PXM01]